MSVFYSSGILGAIHSYGMEWIVPIMDILSKITLNKIDEKHIIHFKSLPVVFFVHLHFSSFVTSRLLQIVFFYQYRYFGTLICQVWLQVTEGYYLSFFNISCCIHVLNVISPSYFRKLCVFFLTYWTHINLAPISESMVKIPVTFQTW